MKLLRIFFMLVMCLILSITVSYTLEAQEPNIPIIVEPVYPENQNPQTKGYFDLDVLPGDKLNLELKITNDSATDTNISLESANAFTNPLGGMMYQKEINSTDTILLDDAVKMENYIKSEETFTIPASSSVTVPIELTVPEVDGQTLLGGILVTIKGEQIKEQQEVEEDTANFIINTETVYAIAIQLNLPNIVQSNFKLGKSKFYGGTAQVVVEMINDAQKIQKEVTGSYSVSDINGNELFSGEFGPFNMAPKSMIRYPFQWGYETLEEGEYTIAITGNTAESEFTATESFTIDNNAVEEFIEKAQPTVTTTENDDGIPTWIWFLGILAVGIVMFILGRRRA